MEKKNKIQMVNNLYLRRRNILPLFIRFILYICEKTQKVNQASLNFINELSKKRNRQGIKKDLSIGINIIILLAWFHGQSQLSQLHSLLLKKV